MYPDYYSSQLNTIISLEESISSSLDNISSFLSLIVFILVLTFIVAFVRKIFAVGR